MARDNKTKYVILGVLSVGGPKSGYEINRWVEEMIVHFWKESYGQIYPMLSKLSRDGLIRRTSNPSGNRDRHEYRITPAGERELSRWVVRAAEPLPARNELLLKLFFGRTVGPRALVPIVEASRDGSAQLAKFYAEAEKVLRAQLREGTNPEVPYWLITLRCGVMVIEARRAWAEETLRALKNMGDAERTTRRRATMASASRAPAPDARRTSASRSPRSARR